MSYESAYIISGFVILFGIGSLFWGVGRMIANRKHSWLITGFALTLFLIKIEYLFDFWATPFGLNNVEIWQFLIMVAIAGIWSLLSIILIPLNVSEINLDAHYFKIHTVFFSLGASNTILNTFWDFFVIDEPWLSFETFFRVFFTVVAIFLAINKDRFLHYATLILFIIGPVIFYLFRFLTP